jgi:hypothetical protein
MKKRFMLLGALALALMLVFAGCGVSSSSSDSGGTYIGDTRAVLYAEQPDVWTGAMDVTAQVTFYGAWGLNLSAADFAVNGGATVSGVSVYSGTVTVTVDFAANGPITIKTYKVSIAPTSEVIRGSATVTITQDMSYRIELKPGPAVNAAAADVTADVTFTGAAGLSVSAPGLSLSTADFQVSPDAAITEVRVVSDTATVTVSFAANTSATSTKTYIVSTVSTGGLITDGTMVTITQEVKTLPGEITVLPPPISDFDIALTGPAAQILWLNGTITASVANYQQFGNFTWYIDNVQTVGLTAAIGTFAMIARNYTLGTHSLTVIARKIDDSKSSYSRTVDFTIIKEIENETE